MTDRIPGAMADSVVRVFGRGEAFDSDGFITLFTDRPMYQFGNGAPCLDKEAIRASVAAFFSGVQALYHDIRNMWEVGDIVFVEMDVVYWRKDGSSVRLPCADTFRFDGDKIQELRIFMDASPVFNAALEIPKLSSVLTVSAGKQVSTPGVMRRYFADHLEGKARVAKGLGPKWSTAGPKWNISEALPMSTLDVVSAMQAAAFAKDWDRFRPYFADSVYYRVGNVFEGQGPAAVASYLRDLPANGFQITAMEARGSWGTANIALAEYTMRGIRGFDREILVYPCVDIYRFADDRVCDWRVYPVDRTFIAPSSAVTLRPLPTPATVSDQARTPKLEIINAFQTALRDGKWELALSHLTGDVVMRVANRAEVSGPAAVVGELGDLFTRQLRPTTAQYVGAWEFGNILVTELTVQAARLPAGDHVSYPCVETYRFDAMRIKEWRIYPMEATLLAAYEPASGRIGGI